LQAYAYYKGKDGKLIPLNVVRVDTILFPSAVRVEIEEYPEAKLCAASEALTHRLGMAGLIHPHETLVEAVSRIRQEYFNAQTQLGKAVYDLNVARRRPFYWLWLWFKGEFKNG
jgi:hypothetical protein